MAYSKHTWSTNDVITTALMNALETGAEEAYLWSEAVIDSDKDMSGNNLTNIGVMDAGNFKVVASDDIRYEGVARAVTPINTWTKVVEFTMPGGLSSGSVIRVTATATATNAGSKYRIYVNGVAVGTEHTTPAGGGAVNGSDDITLQRGDTLEVWGYNSTAGGTLISNIKLKYTDPFTSWGETTP